MEYNPSIHKHTLQIHVLIYKTVNRFWQLNYFFLDDQTRVKRSVTKKENKQQSADGKVMMQQPTHTDNPCDSVSAQFTNNTTNNVLQ